LLEISGSHSNIISDSYVFHYGNELVSRTGNKEIRHFVTTNFDQKYPLCIRFSFSGVNLNRKTLGGELFPERRTELR